MSCHSSHEELTSAGGRRSEQQAVCKLATMYTEHICGYCVTCKTVASRPPHRAFCRTESYTPGVQPAVFQRGVTVPASNPTCALSHAPRHPSFGLLAPPRSRNPRKKQGVSLLEEGSASAAACNKEISKPGAAILEKPSETKRI